MTSQISPPSGPPGSGRFSRRRLRIAVAVAASAATLAAASVTVLGSATAGAADQPALASRSEHTTRDVIANLWEWNWASIAKECTTVLGPKGYGGVQVAPAAGLAVARPDGPVHPWWEVYQPVDYKLTSRMGNEAQFKSMVATCRKAGVKVYVDAVINHMTGQGNISYGGVSYTKYSYDGLYTSANFHHTPGRLPDRERQHRGLQQLPAGASSASWSACRTCAPRPATSATGWPPTSTS